MSVERDRAMAFLNVVETAVEAGYNKVSAFITGVREQIDTLDAQHNGAKPEPGKPDVEQMISDIADAAEAHMDGRKSAWRKVNRGLYQSDAGFRTLYSRWNQIPAQYKSGVNKSNKANGIPTTDLLNNLGKLRKDLGL